MKISLLQFCFRLSFFLLLFTGCRSAKTTFSFHPETGNFATIPATPAAPVSSPESISQIPEKRAKTVSFSPEKVKPFLALALPETNTKTEPTTQKIIPEKAFKKLALKKIKDIKDGPAGGPWSLISGIFLGIGMVLLLAALIMAIIGTSGAGTLALIGGSSFLAGSIVALISLLKY